MDLPTRIRDLRVRAGLTKTALAKPRYTVSFVSQIESGRRRPSPEATAFFADRLGVTAQYLMTGIPEDVEQQLRYALEEGQAALRRDQSAEAESIFRQAHDRAVEVGLPGLAARARVYVAEAIARQGRPNDAIDAYEQALEGDLFDRDRGFAVAGLAKLYRTVGDLTYAAELIESFLSRAHRGPLDPALVGELQSVLVSIYFERGDIPRAERWARKALAAAAEVPSIELRARSYLSAGRALAEVDRQGEALEFATRARILADELGDRSRVALLHDAAAYFCLNADPARIEEADDHLERADALVGGTDTAGELTFAFLERGRLALRLGDAEAALDMVEQGLSWASGSELESAGCLVLKGRALAGLGRSEEARNALLEAASMFRSQGAHRKEAACWRELGVLDLAGGDVSSAAGALRSGLEALDSVRAQS